MRQTFILLVIMALFSNVQMSAEETDLWTGSITYSGWKAEGGDSIVVSGDAFANAVEGYKIGLEYTVTPNSAWSAIEVWPYGGDESIGSTGGLSADDTSSKIALTATDIATLQEKGMKIGATGVTITRVYLDDGTNVSQSTVLWEGSKSYANWAAAGGNLTISASKLSDLEAGDQISIEFTIDDASAYSVEIWNWAAGVPSNCLFNTSDGTSPVAYTVDEAYVPYLLSDGFIMGGNNVTYTKITLVKAGSTDGINAINKPEATDNVIYSIDGKILNSIPSSGVYVKNGKKYLAVPTNR